MWHLDSGCSRHMSYDKSLFSNLEKYHGGYVTFGDGKSSNVGRCSIDSPGIHWLDSILLVDGLKINLLSISQMCDSHHEVHFTKIDCYILDKKDKIVMHEIRTLNNSYGLTLLDFTTK